MCLIETKSYSLELQDFYKLDREERGKVIIEQNLYPKAIMDYSFKIPSQFTKNRKYHITNKDNNWSCDCLDFTHRGKECKHIFAIKFWLQLKEELNNQLYENQDIIPKCVYCNSIRTVKFGVRNNKQRFRCETCNKTFIANPEFKGINADPKAVVLAIDLYFKGLSLRKIKDTLKSYSNIKVTHETIRQWKNKFIVKINDYVSNFKPNTTNWHTDETMIKSKKQQVWVWNTIDEDTKFLIASNVSNSRSLQETREHFKICKENVANKPELVYTDGLQTYNKALKKELRALPKQWYKVEGTRHIRSVGLGKNNLIERHHSTQKERIKVMRGLPNKESVIKHSNDFRTYYNFIRPNQSLNGLTPAQACGFEKEDWVSLIKKSTRVDKNSVS